MSVQAFRSTGVEVQETAVRPGGATTMDRTRTPKGAWLIVALLFSFMLINFADKTVIGIAAVPIMQELKLSPSGFGLVGSSFYLLFALSAVVTGFVVNDNEVWGRPVGVAVAHDGALLISEDGNGTIWRVSH